MALRKIDDAVRDYDRAIAIKPQGLQTLFNSRGKAWVAKGDSNARLQDFHASDQFDPSYVEAYNNRGLSNEVLGRRAEAIADFRKAQSIDPADLVSKQQLRVLGSDLPGLAQNRHAEGQPRCQVLGRLRFMSPHPTPA